MTVTPPHVLERQTQAQRVLLPLEPIGASGRHVLHVAMTWTLRATPQAVVRIGERWRIPRELPPHALVATDLQISGDSLFVSRGYCRLDHALECAQGRDVSPGQLIELTIANVGPIAYSLPPLGWFAHVV